MSIVLMTTTKNQYCKKNNGLLDFGLRHLVKFHYWTCVDFNAIYFFKNKYQNVVGNYDRINHSQQKKFLRCSLFQYHLNVIYHRQTTDKWSHLSQTPDNQTPTCPTFHIQPFGILREEKHHCKFGANKNFVWPGP